jgi:hypothetical protein
MPFRITAFVFLLLLSSTVWAQRKATVFGIVRDSSNAVLEDVNVAGVGKSFGTITAKDGSFVLTVPSEETFQLAFSFVGRNTIYLEIAALQPGTSKRVDVVMGTATKLGTVVVEGAQEREKVSTMSIDPKSLEVMPNISGNFEAILKTLPGVSSNNELSSQYNVRGGNYDENLIYVNDIEIYRPFLVRSGQQEGLSFINPDMVNNVKFSAGGFEARYGDRMSSVLDVRYKQPRKFGVTTHASLMGGNVTVEGSSKNLRLNYIAGARYRSNNYLLNSLDVQGDYKPRFADVQSLLTYHLRDNLEISWLANYAENSYLIVPQNRETVFGTVTNALRLNIGFEGAELMRYRTMMSGLTLSYRPSNKVVLKFISSAFNTIENEYFSVEGAYRLDQLESNLGSDNFAESVANRGTGYFINHARNNLEATVVNIGHRGYYSSGAHNLQWGVQYQREIIYDKLHEWKYMDSADFSVPLLVNGNFEMNELYRGRVNMSSNRYTAYLQNAQTIHQASNMVFSYGVRTNYWDVNYQNVISPRFQFSFEPNRRHNRDIRFNNKGDSLLKKDVSVKAAFGYYYQPPFYRELRNLKGELNTDVQAQRAIHFVLGTDFLFDAWGRPFKFSAEGYYKKLDGLIPYEIDNVRIRYYAENSSQGFATGADFRVNGEFLKGIESWASLSFMRVAENLSNDSIVASDGSKKYPGYIPRPTDQRVNFSLFFQDELAKNPKYKMHMMLVYGSGLPFGPPNKHVYSDKQRMPPYRRVDIGFSKMIVDEKLPKDKRSGLTKTIKSAWISLEVFNLLQMNNTISYLWVKDVTNTQYAVPNYLTTRRVNLALLLKF